MLARTLGRTIQELEATMTAEEFGWWQAEYMRHPWGEYSADLRAGVIASTIFNMNRGQGTKALAPIDFMPLQRGATKDQEAVEDGPDAFMKRLGKNGRQ